MIVVYRLEDEAPRHRDSCGPERCEGCGSWGVLGTDDEYPSRPVWREINCPCALRHLELGLPRRHWCHSTPHTAERCRQVRAARGPLPPLEVPS